MNAIITVSTRIRTDHPRVNRSVKRWRRRGGGMVRMVGDGGGAVLGAAPARHVSPGPGDA